MATATTEPVRLPPGPRGPKTVQAVALFWLVDQNRTVAALARRYGSTFSLSLPIFGQTVVISDPTHVKDLFSTSRNLLGRAKNNLGEIIGPGSLFNLEGDELLERRRLLLPPFHGNRVRSYEQLIEEEVMREVANWPQGREFETLPSMSRITLNAILRAVFGAEGPALDELRALILPAVELGSRIAFLPPIARRDLGRWSPKGRLLQYRRRIDAIINSIITYTRERR
jgi:cytochrome P450